MANPDHVQAVKSLYAAFQSGDTSAFLALLTDDVVFTMPEMPGVPLRTEYRGKDGVVQFLADRVPVLRYTLFEPHKFFSDQDTVLVLGETGGEVIRSGREFRYRWVQLFEFAPGNLIRRFHEFLDTNVLVSAFSERNT
jgi:ketosteroid isomerase-like protein